MTISIPAGDLTGTVTIDPTADLIYEGNETVIATIASVSGGNGTTIGTPDSATVTITDEQSVPTVWLLSTSAIEGNPVVFEFTSTNPLLLKCARKK
jgi:hypothetical protein